MNPNLNQLGLGGLTVCITTFLLGIFVYVKNRKQFFNQIWFLFCCTVSIMGLGFYNIDISTNPRDALFWWKYTYIGVCFIAVTFLHVDLEMYDRNKTKILYFLYPLFTIFLILTFYSPLFFKGVSWKFGNIYYADGGLFYLFFFLSWCGTVTYAMYIVIHKYLLEKRESRRQHIYWIIAFVVGYFGGIFCFLPAFNINYVYPYSIYLVAVWCIILFIGFAKTQLWEIDTVAHKTFLWIATSLWLIIPGYIVLALILPWLRTLNVFSFTLAELILFYLFLNYYLIFQPKIDHLFRRRKYDYQTLLGKIAEKIATCINVEQLTRQLLTELGETIYLRNSLLYLLAKDKQAYTLIGRRGYEAGDKLANFSDIFITGSLLCAWLHDQHDIVDKEQVKTDPYFESAKSELLSWFEKQNLELLIPIIFENKVIGLLGLGKKENLQIYTLKDKELLKKLGQEIGVTLFNALHYQDILEKERLEGEVKLGQEIQTSLLPKQSPVIAGLKLSGLMQPAKEIGGDYYDFIELPQNNLGIVIGDVSGKGVPAGLLMAMAQTALLTISQEDISPKQVLQRLNQILFKQINGQKFMTMLYFNYDPQTKALSYSSAGHEHILIYRSGKVVGAQQEDSASGKEVREEQKDTTTVPLYPSTTGSVEVIPSGGFVLGMLPEIEEFLEDKEIKLNPGDKVIVYTDGVTEARNHQEELYTLERFTESVQKHGHKPYQELITSLKDEVYSFIGAREQYDDITLLVMETESIEIDRR